MILTDKRRKLIELPRTDGRPGTVTVFKTTYERYKKLCKNQGLEETIDGDGVHFSHRSGTCFLKNLNS